MAWGFLSEHTAEFAVVTSAHRIAAAFERRLTPIYFWKTREGTLHTRRTSGATRLVRAANVFARRPKTVTAEDDHVLVRQRQISRDPGALPSRAEIHASFSQSLAAGLRV